MRQQNHRFVLHVIDSLTTNDGPMSELYNTPRYRPLYTQISLNSERIRFEKASVVPEHHPLRITGNGIWKSMEIYPGPDLTVVSE